MTPHDDDRRPDEAKADELERDLDEMDERQDRLGDEIGGAADEWERRKRDDRVPGADGDPDEADGPEPEAEYPSKDAEEEDG
jgi:hypothetical protein